MDKLTQEDVERKGNIELLDAYKGAVQLLTRVGGTKAEEANHNAKITRSELLKRLGDDG